VKARVGSEREARELAGRLSLRGVASRIRQQGSHVCSNIPYRYRPLVADWMAERLAAVR
jgi:hypothetical protein